MVIITGQRGNDFRGLMCNFGTLRKKLIDQLGFFIEVFGVIGSS